MRFNITAPGFQILQPNESRFMPGLERGQNFKEAIGDNPRAGRESSTSSHWNHA